MFVFVSFVLFWIEFIVVLYVILLELGFWTQIYLSPTLYGRIRRIWNELISLNWQPRSLLWQRSFGPLGSVPPKSMLKKLLMVVCMYIAFLVSFALMVVPIYILYIFIWNCCCFVNGSDSKIVYHFLFWWASVE